MAKYIYDNHGKYKGKILSEEEHISRGGSSPRGTMRIMFYASSVGVFFGGFLYAGSTNKLMGTRTLERTFGDLINGDYNFELSIHTFFPNLLPTSFLALLLSFFLLKILKVKHKYNPSKPEDKRYMEDVNIPYNWSKNQYIIFLTCAGISTPLLLVCLFDIF